MVGPKVYPARARERIPLCNPNSEVEETFFQILRTDAKFSMERYFVRVRLSLLKNLR